MGGKRQGSGRKPLPYKAKCLSIDVPDEMYKELRQLIKDKILEVYPKHDKSHSFNK